jgi:hypothetical protein
VVEEALLRDMVLLKMGEVMTIAVLPLLGLMVDDHLRRSNMDMAMIHTETPLRSASMLPTIQTTGQVFPALNLLHLYLDLDKRVPSDRQSKWMLPPAALQIHLKGLASLEIYGKVMGTWLVWWVFSSKDYNNGVL